MDQSSVARGSVAADSGAIAEAMAGRVFGVEAGGETITLEYTCKLTLYADRHSLRYREMPT